jgi:thiol-disulfide isomerase/thioredoxin
MNWSPCALSLAVVATVACGHPATYPTSAAHPLLGSGLPAIHSRRTLDGQTFDAAQLKGRPVLVKFFAAYCAPCKESLPAAERVHQAHPEVAFIGIDEDESMEAATALARRYGLTFPVIRDESNVLSGRFRIDSMPATFVADRSGVIRWVGGQDQREDDLRRAVEASM